MTTRFHSKVKFLMCLAFLLGTAHASYAQCDQTLSPGANVAAAVSSVASGGTLCLEAGSYPAFNASITKSSMTTIVAAPGLSQSQVTIASVNVGTSQYLQFATMTIGGATVGTSSAAALHIHFVGIRFTGSVCINNPTNVSQDTLVDSSTFANVGTGCTEGRLGVTGNNNSHSVSSGIVISNNVFGPGGCSDGVQIIGGARDVQILNNEFTGIKQGSCTAHADPIQFYGADAPVVTGNYFHGNSTGIMSAGCNGRSGTYTNNVFVTDGEYPDQIVQTGPNGGTYSHNTFGNGARMRFGDPNGCGLVTNVTLMNNIVTGGLSLTNGQSTSTFVIGYNMGFSGPNAISGTPTFVGGSLPSTWAGWRLAAGSAGKNAGSDGLDIGSNVFGQSTSAPAPPTNVRVVVR
jgi:hypothetical protein